MVQTSNEILELASTANGLEGTGIDSQASIAVTVSTVIIVVISALTLFHMVRLLLRDDAKAVSGKRDLIWLAVVSVAVICTTGLIMIGGALGIIGEQTLGTLLTILVTAVGVKLLEGLSRPPATKNTKKTDEGE